MYFQKKDRFAEILTVYVQRVNHGNVPEFPGIINFITECGDYSINLSADGGEVNFFRSDSPSLEISAKTNRIIDMLRGKLDMNQEYLNGSLDIQGDLSLLLNLPRFFASDKGEKGGLSTLEDVQPGKYRGIWKIPRNLSYPLVVFPYFLIFLWGIWNTSLIPDLCASIFSLFFFFYYFFTDRPTLLEWTSSAFFIVNFVSRLIFADGFSDLRISLLSLILGTIFIISILTLRPLSAEYFYFSEHEVLGDPRSRRDTHIVITSLWAIFFFYISHIQGAIIKSSISETIGVVIILIPLGVLFIWSLYYAKNSPVRRSRVGIE